LSKERFTLTPPRPMRHNPGIVQDGRLLTPEEVADRLQISIRTVYDNKGRLGGFYPAGIRCLRFRKDVIDGILEGSSAEGLDVQVPVQGEWLRRPRIQDTQRGGNRQSGASQADREVIRIGDRRHGF
jgi:hypothetical protein